MTTYKAVMRPALQYASSIWSPLASLTSINKLQVMQNAALGTAIGCTQDTSKHHLHDETLILPIHEHLQLYASLYIQKTHSKAQNTYTTHIISSTTPTHAPHCQPCICGQTPPSRRTKHMARRP